MTSIPKADDVQTEGSASGDKIRVKYIFANRDGIHVEIEYYLSDTVLSMKSRLISEWPKEINEVAPSEDRIRLICMGKGILAPGSSCIENFDLPVFLTHPTPINVSVKPVMVESKKSSSRRILASGHNIPSSNSADSGGECCCVIS